MTASDGAGEDPVAVLRRWEDSGARWEVLSATAEWTEVALLTCTGGEVVDRVGSADPHLRAYVAGRASSEDAPPAPG